VVTADFTQHTPLHTKKVPELGSILEKYIIDVKSISTLLTLLHVNRSQTKLTTQYQTPEMKKQIHNQIQETIKIGLTPFIDQKLSSKISHFKYLSFPLTLTLSLSSHSLLLTFLHLSSLSLQFSSFSHFMNLKCIVSFILLIVMFLHSAKSNQS
jgi:hypothetical protein